MGRAGCVRKREEGRVSETEGGEAELVRERERGGGGHAALELERGRLG